MTGFSVNFTTAAGSDAVPPTVLATNPTGSTGVPTNVQLSALFDEPIKPMTVQSIQLTQAGNPVSVSRSTANGNRTVSLVPAALLQPNTAYVLTIAGVQDVAGNTLAPVVVNFTTGAGVDVAASGTAPVFDPPNNATGVGAAVTPTLTFAEPVDPVSVLSATPNSAGVFLRVNATGEFVPTTASVSADGRTVTLTPAAPLASGTQYRLFYNGGVADRAGNVFFGITSVLFTVQ